MEKIERYLNNFLLKEITDDELKQIIEILDVGIYQNILTKEYFDKIFHLINPEKTSLSIFIKFADFLLNIILKEKNDLYFLLNKKIINTLDFYLEKEIENGVDLGLLNKKYNKYLMIDSDKVLYNHFKNNFPSDEKEIQNLFFTNVKNNPSYNVIKIPFENIDESHNELLVKMYIDGLIKEEVWRDLLNKGKIENLWSNEKALDLLIDSGKIEDKMEYYTCIFLKDLNEQSLIEKENIELILSKIEKIWKRRDYNYNVATWLYINAFIKKCDNEKSQNIFISCLEKAPDMMKKYVFSYKETKEILFTLDNISWDNYLKIIKYCFDLNIFLNDFWNKQNIIKYSVLPMLFKFSKTEKEYLTNLDKLIKHYPDMIFLNNKEMMTEIILNNSLNSFNKSSFIKWNEQYRAGQIDLFIKNLKDKRKVNVCENLFNKLFKNYEENPKCKNKEIFINIIENIIKNKGEIKNIKIKNNNEALFFEFFREAEKRVININSTMIINNENMMPDNNASKGRKRL